MSNCYVGIKPCGCMVTAMVDNPERKREVAKQIAAWIRDGLTIERASTEDVRARLRGCECEAVETGQEGLAL